MKDSKKEGPKFLNLRTGTAKAVSFLHSDAHFVFKSLADITAASEAYWVNKLTGKDKHAVKEDRHNKTEEDQELIMAIPGLIGGLLKRVVKKGSSIDDDVVNEMNQAV
jgi:hypothetical protein